MVALARCFDPPVLVRLGEQVSLKDLEEGRLIGSLAALGLHRPSAVNVLLMMPFACCPRMQLDQGTIPFKLQ